MLQTLKNAKFWDTTLLGIALAIIMALQTGLPQKGFDIFKDPAFYMSLATATLGILARGLKPGYVPPTE